MSPLLLVFVSLLFGSSRSCFQCFVGDLRDSLNRLCRGHTLDPHGVGNVDSCFKKVKRAFDNDERVIEAARVGEGYDKQLKDMMNTEILRIVEDLGQKLNSESVFEERLQTAADNFIAAASKLPRASGCFPPCGFQDAGAVYNCITCKYDSCEFLLDCPVKEIKVEENSRTRMQCSVPFHLPQNIKVIWRFAEQEANQFQEVTSGVDTLYSIPSISLQHQGTYQCEIYSDQRSIVRLYYSLIVTPQPVVGHTELQRIFDLSLLPGGQLLSGPGDPPHSFLPSLMLLGACLISTLLLLFLSLGALLWSSVQQLASHEDEEL